MGFGDPLASSTYRFLKRANGNNLEGDIMMELNMITDYYKTCVSEMLTIR